MKKIFVLTGEPSGDKLASKVIAQLKNSRSDIEYLSVGGEHLKALGIKSLYDLKEVTYLGFTKVLLNVFKIKSKINETVKEILKFKPDILFSIDSPDFTLRVAKEVKKKDPNIKAIHFVAPQVWIWREYRIKKLKSFLDHVLLLFPFEKKYFDNEGIQSTFTGHPLLEGQSKSKIDISQIIKDNKKIFSIYPGSRLSEVNVLIPILFQFIKKITTKGDIISIFLPFNGLSNQIGYTTNEPYYSRSQLSLANPNLGWEKTTQYNLGVDFGLFNNRVSGSLNVYKSYTSDLLMSVNIPTLTGFPSTIANIGRTNNKGFEASLNLIPVANEKGFQWASDLNVAWQRDEIEELAYGENDMVDNNWFIGESIGVIYGYDNDGLWQDTPEDQAEMALWNENGYDFSPGNVRPTDQNGDYVMNADDRTILGNTTPRWTLGWNNSFSYKGFELSTLIISRLGYKANIGGEAMTARSNQREIDYWTPDNTDAAFQKPILGQATSGSQDEFSGLLGIQDAGFVKIRNISLGYNFSPEQSEKMGLNNLRVYVQAVNPGSIYQGAAWYDFDTNSTIFNRSFAVGLDIGL